MSCPTCEGRAPLAGGDAIESAEIEAVVSGIEYLVMQRRAGRRLSLAEQDPMEWRLLCEWAAAEDAYERAHQARVRVLVEALPRLMHND